MPVMGLFSKEYKENKRPPKDESVRYVSLFMIDSFISVFLRDWIHCDKEDKKLKKQMY